MLTLIAVLMFAGALAAATFVIGATIVPALPKIRTALAGQDSVPALPSLPPRRVSTLRVAVRPAVQPACWRAAA